MTDLPESLVIGAYTYEMNYVDGSLVHELAYFGKCDNNSHVITIVLTDSDRVMNTIIHEVTHAILYNSAMDKSESVEEEWATTVIANGWSQVYRDNPELLDVFKENWS